jgi:transposase
MSSTPSRPSYVPERLDHLGIVAGVCREIGLAEWLDAQDEHTHERVSVGTATVAMILNGLGFSNRRLYLVPQFFATKPVEHLLGPGIMADDLNDDCLGRALDWLYAHDPTTLFAGIALQARHRFGISARQVHVDTTSFSVSGAYAPADAPESVPEAANAPAPEAVAGDLDAQVVAITYGYSRDHRADLKQWMLALATTREGDVPLFLRPLDGNSSDQVSLLATVEALADQLRAPDESNAEAADQREHPLFVADGGLYSAAAMGRLSAAGIVWVSRVPATLTAAQTALERRDASWQTSADAQTQWWSQELDLPQGRERWVVVRTRSGERQARATLERQATKAHEDWRKRLWHLSTRAFACAADAQQALAHATKTLPAWLKLQPAQVRTEPRYAGRGRPRPGAVPTSQEVFITATCEVDDEQLAHAVERSASFIVATNVLDRTHLADEELIAIYKDQHSVERGFAFLKDPLFLASSVFLNKPERIMALSLVMVLCLLVYRLAEHRLREQLAATSQTIPDQVKKPTNRPTMRWVFQCFEGIELLHIRHGPDAVTSLILRLAPLHQQILTLLGPIYEQFYESSN